MTHMQTTSSNKNWLHWIRTTLSNLHTQASDLTSNTDYTVTRPQLSSTPNNQFITTREAKLLATQVDRSSDVISVKAIGGNSVYFFVKRVLDLVIASILIALTLPMMVMCAVWVAIENAGAFLNKEQQFTSRLVKKDGQSVWVVVPFVRYEFLTSRSAASSQFLMSTGLVALPTLFNVLRGDMSLIGSEILSQQEIEEWADWQFLSFASKPGIIGLSRISGKLSWLANDRTRQEVWYACNQSLAVDARILVKTVQSVMKI